MTIAISDVSICNGALIKLGEEPISDLSQDIKTARLCNSRYAFLRNQVLEAHVWSFATKTLVLPSLIGKPDLDWQYQFQLPNDFIKMVRLEDWKQTYEIQSNSILYTNESPVTIKYIFENTNPGTYSFLFADALSWRLAAELAYPITNSNTIQTTMMQGYEIAMKDARWADSAGKKSPEGPIVDSFIDVRF